MFEIIFEDCELVFMRKVMSKARFNFLPGTQEDTTYDNEYSKVEIIERAGQFSKSVHFIVNGEVIIMNKECLIEFGILSKGSYFGDISILMN